MYYERPTKLRKLDDLSERTARSETSRIFIEQQLLNELMEYRDFS